ncbi:MAG: hypothetical protein KKF44_08875 [Nanoarchaeota archaeon]|nr:hypothetical protein [Nanoarchaeota archaeon]
MNLRECGKDCEAVIKKKKNLKQELDESLTHSIVKIIQEPLLYFSEADVQQELSESIKNISSLKRLYPTSVKKGKNSKTVYKTSAVHMEYGTGGGSRMDIVVFNINEIKNINTCNLKKNQEYLSPDYGIEIGTEKSPDTLAHIKKDITKLKKCKKMGYLIHIYKDITQARSGTKSRVLTEEKIKNNFKKIVSDNVIQNSKIKVLAILLRCYRNQTRMKGKCEIFFEDEWKKVNVSNKQKLNSTILKILQ